MEPTPTLWDRLKVAYRNFFHENRSTTSGILLLILAVVIYRFSGFDDTTRALLVTGLATAALKLLTGTDTGTPPKTPTA